MKQKKNLQEGFYSISQVANLLHLSTHTIRNLEKEFSLEITKDVKGNRVYTLENVEKFKVLIQKTNQAKFSEFKLNQSKSKNDESFQYMTQVASVSDSDGLVDTPSSDNPYEGKNSSTSGYEDYNKDYKFVNKSYSKNSKDSYNENISRNFIPRFSSIHLVSSFSKLFGVMSFSVIFLFSLILIGAFSLNTFLKDFDPNKLFLNYDRKSMSNVLQSTSEDWNYRFDVNVPAYMNNSLNVSGSLAGSLANFQIITVGQVSITETGISAPNVVNLVSTRPGESVILVDNTNRNQPIISLASNPEFNNVTINNLSGVTQLDSTTIQTIQDNIEIPTANADAETLGGLSATDFLRSNANTVYTGGTLEFSPTSTVKFSNLSSNTFLRLDSQNVLTSFDITAGPNISISTTATSLIISANTGATSNVFSSAAVKDLFLGTTNFDENYRLVSTVSELNKLHTLSGNLVTSTNLSTILLSTFTNIDTNASDDLDNAVLITSIGGKTIYSTNTWYGTQDFAKIKADLIEVESNGLIKLTSGSVPVNTDSALYNYGNRIYFKDLPLAQVANTSINDNVNKLAIFVTNASGELFLQGTSSLALDVFETGANGQIIGVFGNATKYLNVTGDLSVSSTSSSEISFQINNVNSNPGTFGSTTYIPVITVNSKGQITSISTAAASSANNFTTSVSFSAPELAKRVLTVNRNGLSDLTASFSFGSGDIISALGFTPLKNSSDTLSGNLVITQTLASATLYQNGNLVCDRSGNCSDVYRDTTNANNFVSGITFSTPAAALRTLTLTREGLSSLTATFSMTSSDVITALGYTPLQASSTSADKFINSYGIGTSYINQNLTLNFSLGRSDGAVILASTYFTPKEITTALGYTPLRASDTEAEKYINSFGVSNTFSSQNVSYFFSIARNDGITFPASFSLVPSVITTALGYTPLQASDTAPSYFVSDINFSDASSNLKVFNLIRSGTNPLSALFSMSSSDIISALGYTPVNRSGDTISGNVTILGTLAASKFFQNGNIVCDSSGNCSSGYLHGSGSTGYLSVFTSTNSLGNSVIFESFSNGYIGIGTTNPGEKLDVFGAIKLSQNMGTAARNNALYQDGGVLYWNGQAVGVVGSTAPGGISGTKDYIPYFNTKDTLIASELYYESGSTERSLELIASGVIPTYFALGHKGGYSLKLGVAANSSNFYTNFDSEDDVVLMNVSNLHTADLLFALENDLGKMLFLFGKNANQKAPFAMTYNNANGRGYFGINTTSPNYNLEVIGSAKITETFAASTFSNPANNSLVFLSGGNFRGNISAAIGTFTNLTLANALTVSYGGTGLTQSPANGQLLIGSNGGYSLSPLIAGNNITISTLAGSITINAVLGGTNPNNYVTSILFSDPTATQKTLVLEREGLSTLTATFSLSSADVTTALNYVPLRATDTVAESYINSFGLSSTPSTQNLTYFFSIARNDGVTFPVSFALTPRVITLALGYTPLQASDTSADKYIESIGTGFNYISQNVQMDISLGRSDLSVLNSITVFTPSVITTALGYIPLQASDTEAEKYINSFGVSNTFSSQNVSYFFSIARNDGLTFPITFALTPSVITTALGYIPLQASDTAPDKFIASFGSSTSFLSQNVIYNFSIATSDGVTLPTSIAVSPSVVTTALGYTPFDSNAFNAANITLALGYIPLQASDTEAEKYINSFGVSNTFSSQNVSYFFSIARNDGVTFPSSFSLTPSVVTTALGYIPLKNISDTLAGNLTVTGNIFTNQLYTSTAVATVSLSARHLFLADTTYTDKFLHIDPNIGNFNSKFILDMNVGSSINTTLGMFIQSVKFSSPSLNKNLTFNVLDPALNTRLDIVTTGTIPTIEGNTINLYGAALFGGDASFNNLGVTNQFSSGTAVVSGNLSAGSAYINGFFSAGNATLGSTSIVGNFSASTANFAGNVTLDSSQTLAVGYFSSPLSSGIFNFQTGTIAASFFSAPNLTNTFTFLGNISAANGTFLTLSSQTLNINNLFTVDETGSVFNNSVTFNDTIEFNAVGDLAVANDLVFTNTALSKVRSANDLTFEVGEPFNSSNLTVNLFNSGEFIVNGDMQLNGVLNTVPSGFFSTPLSNNTFNFSGRVSAPNASFGLIDLDISPRNNSRPFLSVNQSSNRLELVSGFNQTPRGVWFGIAQPFTWRGVQAIDTLGNTMFLGPAGGSSVGGQVIIGSDDPYYYSHPDSQQWLMISNKGRQAFDASGGTVGLSIIDSFAATNLNTNWIWKRGGTLFISTINKERTFNYNGLEMRSNIYFGNAYFDLITLRASNASYTGRVEVDPGGLLVHNDQYGAIRIGVGGGTTINQAGTPWLNYWSQGGWFDIGSNWNQDGTGIRFNIGATSTGNYINAMRISSTRNLNIEGIVSVDGADNRTLCTSTTGFNLEIKNGACGTSSIRYKENVTTLPYGLAEIMRLNPVEYNYKGFTEENAGGRTKERLGFIAEEMNEIIPEVVLINDEGLVDSIEYKDLVPLAIKGIQEQQIQIENLSIAQSTINFSEATSMYNSLMNTIDALSMSTDNGDLVVSTDLIVNGKTILNQTTFTGDVQMGQMTFNTLENSLNVLGASCVRPDGTLDDALCQTQSLFLMKSKAGNLNIFDGKVVLKPNGDMQVEKINVTEIKADEYKVASTSQVSGTETLLANQTEIVINTSKVKANSKIFVTASNNLEGKTLYVDEKVEGFSFKVKINQSMTTDVKFDWFILNVE